MNRPLFAILATITLDAAGIGLTLPIIPSLLRDVGHTGDLGWRFGAFLSLYALMQFIASPLLGMLSDRFGRRPVLLASLAGAAIDYLFMAFAPTLALLFIGRAIAGATAANMAVASAYITDITPDSQRARRFGQLSACFGLGFIAGPVLGGTLGDIWVRAPFIAAAVLNGINLVVTFLVLKESRTPGIAEGERPSLNPLAPLRWALTFPALLPLLGAYVILGFIGEIAGTIWVLYGEDRFGWDTVTIGISLAGFGVFHALAQAFLVGPIAERYGARRALVVGIGADTLAYVLIALATQGWMAFMLLPLFCLGGLGGPAMQSLLTARVSADHQGRLQGVLASMTSLASIFGPLLISSLYFASRAQVPGLVWLVGAALYLVCLPLLLSASRSQPGTAT
ncbi:MAG: Tet(A)/Tet(B)/Tet(C) family tetracycline efflux MFS transporter [Rhizobiales bacterium]|nr:Tet(A)/Tet(B)/Tet(C) family tetracycline efflux MFS transporter [Hyphomicrobiales bacterium]